MISRTFGKLNIMTIDADCQQLKHNYFTIDPHLELWATDSNHVISMATAVASLNVERCEIIESVPI